jgi:hypothetical protein
MTSTIEKVARALLMTPQNTEYYGDAHLEKVLAATTHDSDCEFGEYCDFCWANDVRGDARAAITAILEDMHEPSEAVRAAGADGVKFWLGDDRWEEMVHGDPDEWPDVPPAMTEALQAMLSKYEEEALGDG